MPVRKHHSYRKVVVAVAGSAGILVAANACASTDSSPVAATVVTAAAVPSTAKPAEPARLTIAQARIKYRDISAPYNAAITALNTAAHEGTTWPTFKADLQTAVAANEAWKRQIRATRWPLVIQPLIDTMLKTEIPAEISCDQAMISAGGLEGAGTTFNDDPSCKDSPATADKIRRILSLPPTVG
ncbi:MAG TPA: hypothetical protein VF060_20295 [Trebonia sp.]